METAIAAIVGFVLGQGIMYAAMRSRSATSEALKDSHDVIRELTARVGEIARESAAATMAVPNLPTRMQFVTSALNKPPFEVNGVRAKGDEEGDVSNPPPDDDDDVPAGSFLRAPDENAPSGADLLAAIEEQARA